MWEDGGAFVTPDLVPQPKEKVMRPPRRETWVAACLAVLVALPLTGCGNKSDTPKDPRPRPAPPPVLNTSAGELAKAFRTNRGAAAAKYGGKVLRVEGVVAA